MKEFLQQIVQDKNHQYSLREVVILLFVLCLISSWIAQQFLHLPVPEFMFYGFTSLIAAGCFGYSIEKKSTNNNNQNNLSA
jgi:hypothetical protein